MIGFDGQWEMGQDSSYKLKKNSLLCVLLENLIGNCRDI